MTARTIALVIASVIVLGQFVSAQSILPLPPVGALIVAGITVLGSFWLLHLPSVSDYVIGSEPEPGQAAARVTAYLPPPPSG